LLAQAQIEQKPELPPSLNFGPKDSLSVIDLIDLFGDKMGRPLKYEILMSSIYEHNHLALDSRLAENYLGWSPQYSLNETVSLTANWYRDYLNGSDAQVLMRNQIDNFKEGKW
jgi:CDP-glucose 4,6-dehydratase